MTLPLILSSLIILLAAAAKQLKLLTVAGAISASGIGLSSLYLGGSTAVELLFLFFITSNLLGFWRRQKKRELGYEKGGTRDEWQVLANGGPAILGLLAGRTLHFAHLGVQPGLILFAAALAEAAADTWATEIGSAINSRTRSIISGKPLCTGQSGGVSIPGTCASAAGAALISICLYWFVNTRLPVHILVAVALAGFSGAILDSLLGATVQAQFQDASGRIVENFVGPEHKLRGLSWFRNDAVNFVSGGISVLFMCWTLWKS